MPTATGTRPTMGPKKIEMNGENLEDVMPEITRSEPEEVEQWVIEEGQYVKKKIPRVEVSLDADDADEDAAELSAAWYEGRGREMEAKWLNADMRYSSKQLSDGWVKVNPAHYKDQRFQVKNLPGLGEVITFQDCFLCEKPIEKAEADRQRRARKRRERQLARMYSIGVGSMDPEAVSGRFGDNASIINTLGKDDGFRQGIEAATLQSLPYDSPMAVQARALANSVVSHRTEAERMQYLRRLSEG
jgi:hypothetical protein